MKVEEFLENAEPKGDPEFFTFRQWEVRVLIKLVRQLILQRNMRPFKEGTSPQQSQYFAQLTIKAERDALEMIINGEAEPDGIEPKEDPKSLEKESACTCTPQSNKGTWMEGVNYYCPIHGR